MLHHGLQWSKPEYVNIPDLSTFCVDTNTFAINDFQTICLAPSIPFTWALSVIQRIKYYQVYFYTNFKFEMISSDKSEVMIVN